MFISHNRSFIASEAVGINVRVKLTTAVGGEAAVAIAGAGEDFIGVTETPAASGKAVSVRLKNSSGTATFIAASSFAYGAQVYGVAAGKVDDVASGNLLVGTALEASSGDGAQVEVLHAVHSPIAGAAQAAATDAATTQALANALRSALIARGIITGAA